MLHNLNNLVVPVNKGNDIHVTQQVMPTAAEKHCPCFIRKLTSCSLLQREQITCDVQKKNCRKVGVVSLFATARGGS